MGGEQHHSWYDDLIPALTYLQCVCLSVSLFPITLSFQPDQIRMTLILKSFVWHVEKHRLSGRDRE